MLIPHKDVQMCIENSFEAVRPRHQFMSSVIGLLNRDMKPYMDCTDLPNHGNEPLELPTSAFYIIRFVYYQSLSKLSSITPNIAL